MLKNILYFLIIIVAIYLILMLLKNPNKISSMQVGTNETLIDADKLSNENNSSNFTYSLWFYVNDWNYKFGEEKFLLERGANSPKITLGAMQNDISITINCFPTSSMTDTTMESVPHTCSIKNFPLQKWINLVISLQNQTLDIYLDGKLHKTCVLAGVPNINSESPVKITPNGGFNGWTSNFQYWNSASNPQEVYNIYKKGYGGGGLGNFFNKYKLRFEFLKDNKVAGSFEV